MSKAVITGIGLVSPLGCDLQVCWDRLKQGYSGIRRVQAFDVTEYASKIAGEVVEFDADAFVPKKEQRRMDRYSILALGAAELAVRDAGLDTEAENGERMGCIVSSGIGGLQTLEEQHKNLLERGPKRCSPFMIPQMISNMGGGLIAIRYGLQGANYAIVSACASAAHSIGAAMRLIERGDADVMFSGGSEASVCPLGLGGFSSMRALSTRNDDPEHASRPFDAERDGFVIAEGAGVVIIESLEHAQRRGARIYCELAGFGETCDAYHMTAPMEDGGGAARAAERQDGNAGHQGGAGRRGRPEGHDQFVQVHDRPPPGRGGRVRDGRVRAGAASRRAAADDELRDARSRVRPGLHSQPGPGHPGGRLPEQLAGLRRSQRLHRHAADAVARGLARARCAAAGRGA